MGRLSRITGSLAGLVALAAGGAWLALRAPDFPAEQLQARYGRANSHYADLGGGLVLHYLDSGPVNAPVVILLHGFGDNAFSWDGWTERLSPRYRVIALDQPGHGLSAAPVGFVASPDSMADAAERFAAKLGLHSVAVAGNSMGGGVAWHLAVRHPDRVGALILVDAAGFPNEKPPAKIPLAFKILQYRAGRAFLRNIDNRPLIDEGLKTDVYDKSVITPAFVDRWAEFQRAPGHRAILMALNPTGFGNASAAVLQTIKVPTLVINGEADVLVEPASARKFAAAIPGAKLILYPNVGHLPQVEIPQRSAADVAEFLQGQH